MSGHRTLFARRVLLSLSVTLSGCSGNHDVLAAAGEHARHISFIWWAMVVVCGFMYLLVLAFLVHAFVRAHPRRRAMHETPDLREDRPALLRTLSVWTGLIVVGLVGLTLTSYVVDARLANAGKDPQIEIEVTGYQWWWRVRYKTDNPSRQFETANELHLPLDTPVTIRLKSQDVIHSFWVPNLHGKQDLIPGRESAIQLRAERVGTYRGECAEFCGVQHAHMAFDVIVESREAFEHWSDRQRQSAREPELASAVQGRHVFMRSACIMCHSIRGTPASASVGPDLTHVASRRHLAAGTLTMNKGNLAGWIADPQGVKPGNHMPNVRLTPQELTALVDYLLELD